MNIYHCLIGTPGCTWTLEYPDQEAVESDIKNDSLYVLKDCGEIIAVAAAGAFGELDHLQFTLKNPCELARIGVIPSRQKQGVGTVILQNILSAAKARGFGGIRMLVSKTNPAALALYEKNGFKRRGETFMYDIDFYCYQMDFSIIKTSRLLIRPFRPDDWQDLYDYLSQAEVVEYEPYEPFTIDAAKLEAIDRLQNHDFFAVCLNTTA